MAPKRVITFQVTRSDHQAVIAMCYAKMNIPTTTVNKITLGFV